MTSPRRAAGELRARASPTRCRSGAARPMQQQHWPQSGSVVGRWRAGRRQLVASCALAGVPRGRWCEAPAAAVRGGPGARPCIGTRSHLSPSRHGRREPRGRQAGAASVALGRARLDAPLGRRGAGVARRGARRRPAVLVCRCGGSPPRPPPCRLRRWLAREWRLDPGSYGGGGPWLFRAWPGSPPSACAKAFQTQAQAASRSRAAAAGPAVLSLFSSLSMAARSRRPMTCDHRLSAAPCT